MPDSSEERFKSHVVVVEEVILKHRNYVQITCVMSPLSNIVRYQFYSSNPQKSASDVGLSEDACVHHFTVYSASNSAAKYPENTLADY